MESISINQLKTKYKVIVMNNQERYNFHFDNVLDEDEISVLLSDTGEQSPENLISKNLTIEKNDKLPLAAVSDNSEMTSLEKEVLRGFPEMYRYNYRTVNNTKEKKILFGLLGKKITEYDENGKIITETKTGRWFAGKNNYTIVKTYDEDGNLFTKVPYDKDGNSGKGTVYYASGNKMDGVFVKTGKYGEPWGSKTLSIHENCPQEFSDPSNRYSKSLGERITTSDGSNGVEVQAEYYVIKNAECKKTKGKVIYYPSGNATYSREI